MTNLELINKLKLTKKSSLNLGLSSDKQRNQALEEMALALEKNKTKILKANQADINILEPNNSMRDRLLLTNDRIQQTINDIKRVISLDDPLNKILEQREISTGLKLKKITVPFGIIGIIYESRPNVTVDVISLCLKSGNAIVLKGGRDASHSNEVLVKIIKAAIKKAGLDENLILNINPKFRNLVKHMLSAKNYIDLIIPRGGAGLINLVQKNSQIPVIETGAGVCHTYIDESADIGMAVNIINNAKTSRPSVCNAMDTLIIHKKIAAKLLDSLIKKIAASQVEIYGDILSFNILKKLNYPYLYKASLADFGREFLSLKMAIKIVSNINEAIEHIGKYSTKHSEAIVTQDSQNAQKFLTTIDAACVYHNASTRFTDGSQFGLGSEIGISTQKLHTRGPMGIKELTTYKWIIKGQGHIRK